MIFNDERGFPARVISLFYPVFSETDRAAVAIAIASRC